MSKKNFIPIDIIGLIVKSAVGNVDYFKPKRDFYKRVKIRQKRFWQLVRGEASPTTDEINEVAKYFKKSLSIDIPLIQLSLFENKD